MGLAVALQNLCGDMGDSLGIPVRLTMADSRLSRDAELAVYRFVQEALTNVGKYASATEVEVRLEVASGKATVTVRDDGSGFDTTNPRAGHHGLAGMQFRAESLGGSKRIESAPGKGTVVSIEFAEEPDSQFPADANSAT